MKAIHFTPAIVWFVVSIILLTLPQNDIPHSSFFDLPYFDKLVHFAMFFLLTVFFCFPFSKLSAKSVSIATTFNKIVFYIILYGIIMEFVQKFFSDGRSFDMVDILFDAMGSFSGLFAIRQYTFKKNRPQ